MALEGSPPTPGKPLKANFGEIRTYELGEPVFHALG
jgi:hypothetical protein